jgi:hypothetical protein
MLFAGKDGQDLLVMKKHVNLIVIPMESALTEPAPVKMDSKEDFAS